MSAQAHPITIKPQLVYKPWGGDHFGSWGEKRSDEKIGEVVLLSSIKEFQTPVIAHGHQEMTFSEYWNQIGRYIARDHGSYCQEEFPFLIKFLSTQEPLSIQVHPSTDDLKNKFHIDAKGKFESWYILGTGENSKIFFGLKNGYDIRELSDLSARENPLEVFNQFIPKEGDIFCLEPGLIHGTSGNLLFFEIQQPSDFTYRIYDFGRDRVLHLEEARKVIRETSVQKHNSEEILKTPEFSLEVREMRSGQSYFVEAPFKILTYVGPPSRISGSFGKINLVWGATLLLWKGTELLFEESNGEIPVGASPSSPPVSMKRNEALFLLSSE